MADKLKEIFNGDVLFGSFTNGRRTLHVTDATTQLVIKDINVSKVTYPNLPNIEVNSTVVAAAADASGSEIVGANSLIELVTEEFIAAFTMTSETVSEAWAGLPGEHNLNNLSVEDSEPGVRSLVTPNLTGTIQWGGMLSGAYYYIEFDGNSTTKLRRRVGSISGSETIVTGTAYCPVSFDGVSKFYWYQDGIGVKMHDSATNTTTEALTVNVGPTTSYATSAFCNGLFIYKPSSATTSLYIYNVATGEQVTIPSRDASSYANTLVFHDGKGGYRVVYTNAGIFSGAYRHHEFTYVGGVATTGAYTPALVYGFKNGINGFCGVSSGGKYNLALYNGVIAECRLLVIDKNFNVISSKLIPGLPASVNTPGLMSVKFRPANSLTDSEKNVLGPRLRLRVTGIEST